jgi:hypothetical protein
MLNAITEHHLTYQPVADYLTKMDDILLKCVIQFLK